MKRRIELRIDELRLPAGSRGGLRALAAIERNLTALLQRADAPLPNDAGGAVARTLHETVGEHAAREPRR